MKALFSRRTLLGASLLPFLPEWPATAAEDTGAVDGDGSSTLRVGDQRGGVRSLLRVAGQLERLPYRIQWASFPVGAPLIAAIGAGALDFGYVGDATATFAFAAGSPVRAITVWTVDGVSDALLVPESSAARTMRDLAGRRVAFVKGSPGHLLILAALRRESMKTEDIIAVPLSAANARSALANGSIDAWAIWDPYAAMAELQDHARIILTAHGVIDEVECGIAGTSAISTRRAELTDFMARVGRAVAWGDAHPEERALGFARDTGIPIGVARRTVSRMQMKPLPSVTDTAIVTHQKVADLYHSAGVIPADIDVSRFYDRSFTIPD